MGGWLSGVLCCAWVGVEVKPTAELAHEHICLAAGHSAHLPFPLSI